MTDVDESLGPCDTPAQLAARAAWVLRDNSNPAGTSTKASPSLYPHQWSWDAAFNAIGLAAVDLPRARVELSSLLAAQWRNGMVPHIVFGPTSEGYFPGPDVWNSASVSDQVPARALTSGICQPPVHAIAVARILHYAERLGAGERHRTQAWVEGLYPRLVAWHRYLAEHRTDRATRLVTIFHGWESGTDNSPRWDEPYAQVVVGADLPPYTRRDKHLVADAAERPSDAEYDRYLWLVHQGQAYGYDPQRWRPQASFCCGDVLFTAIFAAAGDELAAIADRIGAPGAERLRGWASTARAAVAAQSDPLTGLAADVDLRSGRPLRTQTVAGFAPLIAGGTPADLLRPLLEQLFGPDWAGAPGLRYALPPSTSPSAPFFDRRRYWRGPVWPIVNWLLTWALRRQGEGPAAERLEADGVAQLADGTFAEYYDPYSGQPLGSGRQSWTAAAALDWLLYPTP